MSGAAGHVVDAGKSVFNATLNPFSDQNIFRKGPAAVLFPGQNPTVQETAAIAGAPQVAAGAPAAGAGAAGAGSAGAAGTAAGTAGTLGTLRNAATILSAGASIVGAAASVRASKAAARNADSAGTLAPTAPVTMPILGGPNSIVAQRAALQSALFRRGRASTILTEPSSDKLGA